MQTNSKVRRRSHFTLRQAARMGVCASSPSSSTYSMPPEPGFDGSGLLGSEAGVIKGGFAAGMVEDVNVTTRRPTENELAEYMDKTRCTQVRSKAVEVATPGDLGDYPADGAFVNASMELKCVKIFDPAVKTTLGHRAASLGLVFCAAEQLEDAVFVTSTQQVLEVGERETDTFKRTTLVFGPVSGSLLQRTVRATVTLYKKSWASRSGDRQYDAGTIEMACETWQAPGVYEALAGVPLASVAFGVGGGGGVGGQVTPDRETSEEPRGEVTTRLANEMAETAVKRLRAAMLGSKDDDDAMRPMD